MRRAPFGLLVFVLVCGLFRPAAVSAQQSVNFWVGGFVPRGEDARGRDGGRASDDVLVRNLDTLAFNVSDFAHATIGGEWLTNLGNHAEAGLGLGFYRRTVPTVYRYLVNSDGSDIEQQLRLRVVPFTATIRFMPLGHRAPIQPFIGVGVGVFAWRYAESGQFVDVTDSSIFRDSFVATGAATGPLVVAGARIPIGPGTIGGEIRYQSANGKLPADQGFAGRRIDLGGFNYLATFSIRF